MYRSFDGSSQSELGDSQAGIRLLPQKSLLFMLQVGGEDAYEPSIEVTPENCETTDPKSNGTLIGEFVHRNPDLRIEVHASAHQSSVRKWLRVENSDSRPLVLFDVVLERMTLPGVQMSGGGRGWPVFIQDVGYAAVEFPESENILHTSTEFSLEYYPAVTLSPGETYETERAVIRFSKEDPLSALKSDVSEFKLRKSDQLFACYSSRGAHEWEGPNERIINEQLDHLTELKSNWRVPFEYFVIDYGYWSADSNPQQTGEFSFDTAKRFPGGSLSHILGRMISAGIKPGVWVGGCAADKQFAENLRLSLLKLNSERGVKLIKAEFSWDCEDSAHSHTPSKYARYQAARNLMDVFSAVRSQDPEVVVYAAGFARSPWWLKDVDFLANGKDDAPDLPAPSLKDSQILQTDLEHRFFDVDAGTSISYSDSHFWNGKQCWRKNLVMSLARSNQLLLAGELHLLDEDDKLFLQRVAHMRKVHNSSFAETRRILGKPESREVYGYANMAGQRGLVAIYNPSWEVRVLKVSAQDMGCDPLLRNVCVELFPDTEVAAIPAGGHFQGYIAPWEALWFEVGPSDEHCELIEVRHDRTKNYSMVVTPVAPTEFDGIMSLPMEQVCFQTGSAFRCRPMLGRNWQGFPLLIDLKDRPGELYVNNHPLILREKAEFALLYPWTHQYGLVKFGRENLFYLATDESNVSTDRELVFQALPYFSSSACREDWPHARDATAVVVVRYLQDGKPCRPTFDPQFAECAAWLDGIWIEPYRVPPLVPRIHSKYSWAAFMLDLETDWECVRILVPKLLECDYEVEFFLTDQITAAAYASG